MGVTKLLKGIPRGVTLHLIPMDHLKHDFISIYSHYTQVYIFQEWRLSSYAVWVCTCTKTPHPHTFISVLKCLRERNICQTSGFISFHDCYFNRTEYNINFLKVY